MKSRLYAFVLLLPVFLLASCLDIFNLGPTFGEQKQPTEGKGIKSTTVSSVTLDLSVTPGTIYENSSFLIRATVKNPGSEIATNTRIKATKESGDFTLDETEKPLGDLEPPIKERVIPYYQDWDVSAGERSGKISIRLKYDYKTRAGGDIVVYDLDKIKRDEKLMNEAQTSAGILSFEGSKAPIKVSVGDNGAYLYSATHTKDKIMFSIEDSGNGMVTDMQVKVTIKIGDYYCKNNELVDLKFTGSVDIPCDLNLQKPSDYKTTIPFEVEVTYSYETSASKDISITKLS
jgi:hypothetical protein